MRCIRGYAHEIAAIRSLFSAQNEEIGHIVEPPDPLGEQLERVPRPPSWIKISQGEAYRQTPIKRITVKSKLNVMHVFVLMISILVYW